MNRRLTKFSLFVLIYNVLVILFGAFVRASGSGAGCGAHWPTCQGVVVPINPVAETVVEFTHRITSGFALIFVFLLLIFVFRNSQGKSFIKTAAISALIFTLLEAIIGAGLVLFQLVGDNDSLARAFVIASHLINTFLLLASLTFIFEWSRTRVPKKFSMPKGSWLWMGLLTVAVFILAASGAITALGDTLFPAASFLEGVSQDRDSSAHFLIQLRVYHPLIAIAVGIAIYVSLRFLRKSFVTLRLNKYAQYLQVIYLVQIFVGGINVLLLAPIWMQIIHLLLADLIWINYILVINQVVTRDSLTS